MEAEKGKGCKTGTEIRGHLCGDVTFELIPDW